MRSNKKKRIVILIVVILTLLSIINKYHTKYLNDFIKKEDFTYLRIMKHEVIDKSFEEITIKDKKQIQQIYNYIAKQKVRRKIWRGNGLVIKDNVYYDLDFISEGHKQNCSLTLIGDDYIVLTDYNDNKSIVLVYVFKDIDLNYFKTLITDE